MGTAEMTRSTHLLTRKSNLLLGATVLAAASAAAYFVQNRGDSPDSREYPLSWIGCHLSWRDPDAKPSFNGNLRREEAGNPT
ncbi:hypothetical protein NEOLEDRAFT_1178246 [Neolentinus lepideus HHB14362 ss-1]|uniref:Uncharacterized protein n=1 Tax=Neolentinus lepideus HHB14362 ss-1 TaxID=1314782 RepID=A0A165SWZ9_9AGAM|nr:hypothetical protein NEOLEDRAFT_1178246 [Neolentinus lepideus HHB14362 ss-1]